MNAIFEERLIGPPPYTATPDTFAPPLIPRASLNATVAESEQEVDLTPIASLPTQTSGMAESAKRSPTVARKRTTSREYAQMCRCGPNVPPANSTA